MSAKNQIKVPGPTGNVGNSLYTQTAGSKESRTFIPGMRRKTEEADSSSDNNLPPTQPLQIELQARPLAGVLYSVSRDNCGEIFPVYVGRNIIGCEPESDVYLTEETVSPQHALLLIRMIPMKDSSKKVTMSITDSGSDFGTAVNGEQITDDIQSLAAGDVIQIGNSYQFAFIPLDADVYGLAPSSSFVPTPREENRPINTNDYLSFMLPIDNNVYPDAVGEAEEALFYGRSKKKKEDHSNKKTL